MARIVDYYDQHDGDALGCSACDWSGTNGDGSTESFQDLFDISCPKCDTMLLIVSYPMIEQVRAAAEQGDKRALADLAAHEKGED